MANEEEPTWLRLNWQRLLMLYFGRTIDICSKVVILSAWTLFEHEDIFSYNASQQFHISYQKQYINQSRTTFDDLNLLAPLTPAKRRKMIHLFSVTLKSWTQIKLDCLDLNESFIESRYFSINIGKSSRKSSTTFFKLNVMVPTHTPHIACQRVNVSAGKVTMALLVRPERETMFPISNTQQEYLSLIVLHCRDDWWEELGRWKQTSALCVPEHEHLSIYSSVLHFQWKEPMTTCLGHVVTSHIMMCIYLIYCNAAIAKSSCLPSYSVRHRWAVFEWECGDGRNIPENICL